ncbi:hypothetical protein CYMTET_31911 [Cymbomonas tetramitiformis]|uniref:Uncharacterized protein n=1 Tax=Cymbomonas tetramitiformis TaxID=36881 RepID=A0AAE0FGQ0_9CHLO|nr:hypothetical protein CYMTET_31911 [Cymbomonas tetramitiformis]
MHSSIQRRKVLAERFEAQDEPKHAQHLQEVSEQLWSERNLRVLQSWRSEQGQMRQLENEFFGAQSAPHSPTPYTPARASETTPNTPPRGRPREYSHRGASSEVSPTRNVSSAQRFFQLSNTQARRKRSVLRKLSKEERPIRAPDEIIEDAISSASRQLLGKLASNSDLLLQLSPPESTKPTPTPSASARASPTGSRAASPKPSPTQRPAPASTSHKHPSARFPLTISVPTPTSEASEGSIISLSSVPKTPIYEQSHEAQSPDDKDVRRTQTAITQTAATQTSPWPQRLPEELSKPTVSFLLEASHEAEAEPATAPRAHASVLSASSSHCVDPENTEMDLESSGALHHDAPLRPPSGHFRLAGSRDRSFLLEEGGPEHRATPSREMKPHEAALLEGPFPLPPTFPDSDAPAAGEPAVATLPPDKGPSSLRLLAPAVLNASLEVNHM